MKGNQTSLAFALVLGWAGLAPRVAADELWVGRYFQNAVTRFNLSTGANLGNLPGGVSTPLGMAHRGNKVYATAEAANQIRTYDAQTGASLGTFVTANLNAPAAIAFDGVGQAYVANFNDNSVSRFSTTGTYLGRFVTAGSGGLSGPDLGMAFGPDGNLYIPSYWNHKVTRYNGTTGAYMGDFVTAGLGGLTQPRQLVWRSGDLFVSSDSGNKVLRYDAATGAFKNTFIAAGSGGLSGATGMAFVGDTAYLASSGNGKILKYDSLTGAFEGEFASGLGSPVSLQAVPEPATLTAAVMGFLAHRLRSRRK